MKKKFVALLCLGMLCGYARAQAPVSAAAEQSSDEKLVSHRVALGETVLMIAKKYKVMPSDIYELNPEATEGLSTGMLLQIPVDRALVLTEAKKEEKPHYDIRPVQESNVASTPEKPAPAPAARQIVKPVYLASNDAPAPIVAGKAEPAYEQASATLPDNGVFEVTHEVKNGETLTGLARKYNTTIKAITDANSRALRNGLQIGQTLTVPAGPTPDTLEGVVMHQVEKGETLFGLARQYNTTVEAITAYNEKKLRHGLQTGQRLSIMPGNAETVAEGDTTPRTIQHVIKEGDSLEMLASEYHTTTEAIRSQNSKELQKGLQAGQQISIPAYTNP